MGDTEERKRFICKECGRECDLLITMVDIFPTIFSATRKECYAEWVEVPRTSQMTLTPAESSRPSKTARD